VTQERKKPAPLFKDYADIWLHTYVKALRRESTYIRYRDILKSHVYPVLGAKRIDEIRRSEIRDLVLKLHAGGLSRSSVCLARDVLSGPFSYAVDEEIIQINPAVGIVKKLQLDRDRSSAIEPLTREEVQLFLDTCLKHCLSFYPFFLCAFRTGMRLGELLGLQWGDIDWQGKFIRVSRSYKTGKTSPTKTGKFRRVDMSDQLAEVLKSLLTQRKREALETGKPLVEAVFHKDRKPMEQNFARTVFKRVLAKAGIREIRVHDTRHTFASILLSDGASPVYVKEQLGHTSIQMTVDIYGHLIPSSNRESVNRLDTQPSATSPQPAKNKKA
jgi:integrase